MMHVLDVASREASRSGGAFALELLNIHCVDVWRLVSIKVPMLGGFSGPSLLRVKTE